ncbi:hypothetical protein [Puia dinghuensis]|uniref:Lipoprotein n=1 Tax=Puia dinghuensis TaxID=1792502 RepID=A0A8J2XP84_9BACT|nr:hypothetical protein [Puia dinghuensis]GGA87004.1 hypothetical protein GCM10011511_07610 [Puia dinghuensis]
MKPGYFLVSVFLLVIIIAISCGKSGSGSKPKISIESINTVVQHDDSMRALFKLSNAAGLSNGTFVAIRKRLNQAPIPAQDTAGVDTFPVQIPNFNGSSSGEMRFALPAQGFLSQTSDLHINDTLIYKFFVLTTGNVSSDTIPSPKIVILNP